MNKEYNKFCKRCLYSTSHPLGLILDDDGICSGCRIHEEKDKLNWLDRFEKLKKIFETNNSEINPIDDTLISYLVSLFVEVSRVDYKIDEKEIKFITEILAKEFNFNLDLIKEKLNIVRTSEGLIGYHPITKYFNENFDVNFKKKVVLGLWKIAFINNDLDKYEDHLVRKVSDLLYISHSDNMLLRNKAKEDLCL